MAIRSASFDALEPSKKENKRPQSSILESDPFGSVLFQLGRRNFWIMPTSCPDVRHSVYDEQDPTGRPDRSICGWLRVGNETFFLATQTRAPDSATDCSSEKCDSWDSLSDRELQIALLVSNGRATKQIAHHLLISEHTVRSYMRRIFSKLRVSTRPAMVARLMEAGIVPVTSQRGDAAARVRVSSPRGRDAP